jgi:FkbM family methyltransferase
LARNRNTQKAKKIDQKEEPLPFFFNNGYCRGKMTKHGYMLYNPNDLIGKILETQGEFSGSEILLLRQLLKPGNVVIDVGANIGTHTLSMAAMVQPNGFVFSLEPQRITFEFLSANILLNNLINVFPLHAAAGDKPGEILVPVVDPNITSNAGSFAIEGHKFGDDVRVITLDSLSLAQCNLIKVDVEGMEIKVLEGARQIIKQHRPILLIENNYQENSERLITMIKEMNYSLYWFFSEYPDKNYKPDFDVICFPTEWNINVTGLQSVLDEKDTGPNAYTRATGIVFSD